MPPRNTVCIAHLIAIALAANASAQTAHFAKLERQHFDIPPAQSFCRAGDFDGDGAMDLFYCGGSDGTVYYNDGHGYFRKGESVSLRQPLTVADRWLLVFDVDGDGRAEVVTASGFGIELHRLAAGAFITSSLFSQAPAIVDPWLTEGDFDNDGDIDVLGQVSTPVYLENVNGSLQVNPAAGLQQNVSDPTVGLVDGDAFPDLMTSDFSGVSFRRGHGDGTFDPPTLVASAPIRSQSVLADLDGDGDLDLAVGGVFSRLLLLRNDGTSLTGIPTGLTIPTSRLHGTADVDQDGRTDVLFSSLSGYEWIGLDGSGAVHTGSLPIATPNQSLPPVALTNADLDGDGDTDLAGSGGLLLLRAEGSLFRSARVDNPPLPSDSIAAAARDNGGRLMVRLANDPAAQMLFPNANGETTLLKTPGLLGWSDAASTPNGRVLVASGGHLYVGTAGNSSFWVSGPVLTNVRSVATGGGLLLASCSDYPGGLAFVNPVTGAVDDTRSAALPAPRLTDNSQHDRILVADFDADGFVDIVHSFRWLRGQANGQFVDAGDIVPFVPSGIHDLIELDYDGDGDLDLYVARQGFDMLLELDHGQFVDRTLGHIPPETDDCSLLLRGDIDGDGAPDIVTRQLIGGIRFLRNDRGIFRIGTGVPADILALVDIDGDGDADAVTPNGILRNAAGQLHAPRLPLLGANYELHLHWHGAPGEVALGSVFSGISQNAVSYPGVSGLLRVVPASAEVWGTTTILRGDNAFLRQVPRSPVLLGLFVTCQGLVLDRGGVRFTNGIGEIVQ